MTADLLTISHPNDVVTQHVAWLQATFAEQQKSTAVIAVSGGIDSAVSLTLLVKALGPAHVHAVLLPYADQDLTDGQVICHHTQLPSDHIHVQHITPIVDAAWAAVEEHTTQVELRRGNLMARARMMLLFDRAKALNALVCGTENKSEHWLGYWTRFGDAASDLEPLANFYKTQVRQLAEHLGLPQQFLTKAPSAGLWSGQTDETEMGFSYAEADQVMAALIDGFWQREQRWPHMEELSETVQVEGISPTVVQRVVALIKRMHFKHEVPYYPKEESYVR